LALTPRELEIEIENDSFLFVRVSDIRELLAADPDRADLLLKLHAHYAYPFGCLVLAMLGLPLVLRPSREAPLVAAGAGLMISMAYFVTERLLADLGTRDEILSPALGAWLPVLLFGAPGLLSLETMKT